jgi:hypothetical protein
VEKICKNCRWFSGNDCYNDHFVEDDLAGLKDRNIPANSDNLYYTDFERYKAYFSVGSYFGCIHWEGKQ